MGQQPKKKGSSLWSLIVVIIIAILNIFEGEGVVALVVIIVVGTFVAALWLGIKASRAENGNAKSQLQLDGRYRNQREQVHAKARSADIYSQWPSTAKPETKKYAQPIRTVSMGDNDNSPEEHHKQVQMLKDLLKAGIIDRAEYHDRMSCL